MLGSIWGDYATMLGAVLGAGFQAFWEDVWPKFIYDVVMSIKEWWNDIWSGGKSAEIFQEWYEANF